MSGEDGRLTASVDARPFTSIVHFATAGRCPTMQGTLLGLYKLEWLPYKQAKASAYYLLSRLVACLTIYRIACVGEETRGTTGA